MHIVVENALPSGMARAVNASWPAADSDHWHSYNDQNSVKRASRSWDLMPVSAQVALRKLAEFDIRELLGIDDTFPDLEGLNGAGLHEMTAGGRLGLHLDAERHPRREWTRAASAVVYLNSCDGGELELCDEVGNAFESITPAFNRLVLFSCPGQWHRVAECRSTRRSLCLFWWSQSQACATGSDRALFR